MAIEIAKYTCLAKKYSTWVGQQPTSTGGDKYMRGLKYKQEMPQIEEKTPRNGPTVIQELLFSRVFIYFIHHTHTSGLFSFNLHFYSVWIPCLSIFYGMPSCLLVILLCFDSCFLWILLDSIFKYKY